MPHRSLRRLLVVISLFAIGYTAAALYLYFNQRAFIYQPGERFVSPAPPAFALNDRPVTYRSTGGVTLAAWVIPGLPSRATGQWLLICHGNYGNVSFGQRPEFYAAMRDLGISLFAFDYRGFGQSTGSPREQGLYDDAAASYGYLTNTLGVDPGRIVIFGHSLGTGVAIELATHAPAAGLIVEGAYTSVVERAQQLYRWLPVSLVAAERFPSIDRIGHVSIPKLFLHSPDDQIIPFALGQQLYAAASPPKRFVSVKGGHENAFRVDHMAYFGAIDRFLQEIRVAAQR
jgi:fermentation-respiration switch protein FrsA (DUF1100 family)